MAFNKFFEKEFYEWKNKNFPVDYLGRNTGMISMTDVQLMETYTKSMNKGAMFDSRCFNIPENEVTNCFLWRQQDATRNAVQMLGQCNFSHNELHGKSCNNIQDMLMTQKNINFNDMPTAFKRGVCCIKTEQGWIIDKEIPIFSQDRDYIENRFRGEDESVKNL